MIPTEQEYIKAKEICIIYEREKNRLFNLRVEAFEKELQEYFDNNLIDGRFRLYEFGLDSSNGNIVPHSPCMEENYEGGNDADIEAICKRHQVDFSIAPWCYHK